VRHERRRHCSAASVAEASLVYRRGRDAAYVVLVFSVHLPREVDLLSPSPVLLASAQGFWHELKSRGRFPIVDGWRTALSEQVTLEVLLQILGALLVSIVCHAAVVFAALRRWKPQGRVS
jgi:hypothetical protein